ncbi:MAG: ChaN family lipoprotein [Gammaproteobacteria bacterium]|nr:ChaN family lipoprotein [Gammaproteobacteria bacterium]
MKRLLLLLTLPLTLQLYGCSHQPLGEGDLPYPPQREAEVGDILHLRSGYYLDRQRLLQNIVHSPLVYVGELHDNPASHQLELDIVTAVNHAHPNNTAIGLEMFSHSQQPVLNRWIAGELDERAFLKESQWYSRGWGSSFDHYRALLNFAREAQIPLIALNHDKNSDPATDPEIDLNDPYHQAMVKAILGGHDGQDAQTLPRFHYQQSRWDETMAATIVAYLQQQPQQHLVIVAGAWHVEYGFGIPRRVFRRLPIPYSIISSRTIEVAAGREPRLMQVDLPQFPMPAADYLVYQRYEAEKRQEARLGVAFEPQSEVTTAADPVLTGGLRVTKIVPGSAAAAAGVLPDDRLLKLGDAALNESFDLLYEVKSYSMGDQTTLTVQRQGEIFTLPITFTPDNSRHPQ